MAKLHYFNFSWGYVEDARIAMLPSWYHEDGFETAEEAAESFARCLMTQAKVRRQCSTHGKSKALGAYCSRCGLELLWTKKANDYDFALTYFDDLYRVDNDEAPSSSTEDWDEKWCADWECTIPPDMKAINIQRFNQFLEEQGDPEALIYNE